MNADALRPGSKLRQLLRAATLGMLALGCAGAPPPQVPAGSLPRPAQAKPVAPVDELGKPPLASAAPDAPFPSIVQATLSNGLELRVIPRRAYPLLEARLVVFSGTASDAGQIGVSALTGELLKVGGAGSWPGSMLIQRAESLGSSLDVSTTRDSTQISMAVTTGEFERALELISAVALRPRFAATEFAKLKQRELQRLRSAATASAAWAGSMALYRELFRTPDAAHPYARFDATPGELQKLTLPSCRAWYLKNLTPRNATLVVVGDVDVEAARSSAERWFAAWDGSRPAPPKFEMPSRANERIVWLVDRPQSEQSQVYVAGFGPSATSSIWPTAETANQILGGGVAGRLFLDVREKRSLAYRTGSSLLEVAHGPAPIVLSAGTQTAKTDLTVEALLENLTGLRHAPPSPSEVREAARNLSIALLFHTETVGALAALTAKSAILGRPDGYYDAYRRALQNQDAAKVREVAKESFMLDPPVIVVAGDADRVEKSLSRFGRVEVVDPRRNFAARGASPNEPTKRQP